MEKRERIARYEQASELLPHRLRKLALALPDRQKEYAEELRLRTAHPMTVLTPEGEISVAPSNRDALCSVFAVAKRQAPDEIAQKRRLSAARRGEDERALKPPVRRKELRHAPGRDPDLLTHDAQRKAGKLADVVRHAVTHHERAADTEPESAAHA